MKKNLLIDTCVLRNLISPTGFSNDLKQLKSWYDEGLINILAPPSLIEEWEKHRDLKLKEVNKVIKRKFNEIKERALFNFPIETTDVQLDNAEKLLLSQSKVIDELINSTCKIDENSVAGIMWDHKKSRKAPFHNKIDSQNDAIITFSAINEVVKLKETEIIIISENHSDLADLNDRTKIHPDIANPFSEITIVYFSSLSDSIKGIIHMGLPSLESSKKSGKLDNFFPPNPNLPILGQLESYLDRRFKDIKFLPKQFFNRHAPLIINGNCGFQDIPFYINTDNKDLYSLFQKFNESDESQQTFSNINEYEKFKNVCKILYHNLIYGIQLNTSERIEVPNLNDSDCDCQMCRYRKFKFGKALKGTQDNALDNHTLENAYLKYLLGDMSGAINTLKRITDEQENNDRNITKYIANYNLILLKRRFKFESKDLCKTIPDININDALNHCQVNSNKEILEYIHNGKFLKIQGEKFAKILLSIKAQQVDKLNGWSNYLSEFLSCYFETVYTIELNYILLDGFSEITSLTSNFIDGLFASYSSSPELDGRLLSLNDAIIQKLILYANYEDLNKCKKRYGINTINYSNSSNDYSFIRLFNSLFDSFFEIVNEELLKNADGAFLFWSKLRKMLLNCITLAGLLNLDNSDIQQIAAKLLTFLKFQNHLNSFEISKAMSNFLFNFAEHISPETHLEYLKLSIMPSEDQLDLSYSIRNMDEFADKLHLTKDEWYNIKNHYLPKKFGTLLDCNKICLIYKLLNSANFKKEIKEWVDSYLNNNYNSELYYNATMNYIINESKIMSIRYEEEIIARVEKGKRPKLTPRNFYNDEKVDEYLNFCFCYNLPISMHLRKKLESLDLYYKWLLNVDFFDYTIFDSNWLFVHPTMFYYQEFRKSLPLRNWIYDKSINSNDLKLSKLFIQLYGRVI